MVVPEEVARGGVQHALRFAGGAGGVEDEQRVFAVNVGSLRSRPDSPSISSCHQ